MMNVEYKVVEGLHDGIKVVKYIPVDADARAMYWERQAEKLREEVKVLQNKVAVFKALNPKITILRLLLSYVMTACISWWVAS